MRKVFIGVFLSLALLPKAFAEDPSVLQCKDLTESYRAKGAENLKRLEDLLMHMEWLYLKHEEILYNPLWQAESQKNAEFSEARRAEGEVLVRTYRSLSDTYLSLAEGQRTRLARNIKKMRRLLKKISGACSAADFKTCSSAWRQDVEDHLQDYERNLAKYEGMQDELRVRIARLGLETPSDHDDFGSRFFEPFGNLSKAKVKLLTQIRELQDYFDSGFPLPRCCEACLRKNLAPSEDPVLSKVRLDPQGTEGVSGQVVNKASLIQAFEELDAEKKKK